MKWSVSLRMVQISKRPESMFMHLTEESMIPYFGGLGGKTVHKWEAHTIWLQNVGTHNTIRLPVADKTLPRCKRSAEVPCLGMGGSVVDLISELQQEEGRSFNLTFDNLFTSHKMVDCLSNKNHCLHRNNPC